MTVTVPSKDTVHYGLFNDITTLTTQITNSASNGKLAHEFTKIKASKQLALVQSLLATGNLSAATVLSTLTYITAQPGGDQG